MKEIARALGISPPTVCYHKRRLGYQMNDRCATRYDWDAIQAYYNEGHSVSDCERQFGFSRWAWCYAVKRGAVIARPQAMSLTQLLVKGPRSRNNIRRRLIAEGIKDAACEQCGISEWRGAPLSLELHHRNGEKHDNRLENLALLCPNCHSQSDTWGGKNVGTTASVTVLRPSPARPDSAA